MNSISGRHCGIRISMDVRINMDEESIDEEYWPEMQSQIAASTIEVHFGKSNLKETKFNKNQIFSADEIIVHPGFNASNFANNLAIIRLSTDATSNDFCYCKKGFVRLKTVGICVQADNRACRAKMPPTEETCARKENEQLSEWLYDEPCPNTCENYNVPCNVSVPDGMFWGPHCVCKEGFSRLPNKKCVAIKHPKCLEIWKPTSIITTPPPLDSTTRPPRITTMPSLCTNLSTTARTLDKCTDFCGRVVGFEKDCSQFDLGMQYSSAGEILGKHCLSIDYSPRDKYICFNENYGVQIKAYRAIRGMRCIRFVQQYKRKTRRLSSIRSFLCVPHQSPLRFLFSTTGSIPGACCFIAHRTAVLPSISHLASYIKAKGQRFIIIETNCQCTSEKCGTGCKCDAQCKCPCKNQEQGKEGSCKLTKLLSILISIHRTLQTI
ncbi:hypothetical protein Bhyg_12860 [Pseudolycoriella hygida]|uniref:Uncharacterized protein n=1 Tax=Pseudolycoriella hygida TaxID=35572 RepID=A0A9Q0S197_9DIPT|nr:hypothetical protein Bhyg_12860 [Pseudolycoriella hygida]